MDTLENVIRESKPSDISIPFGTDGSISPEVCAKINSKLLLGNSLKTKAVHPGNIYEVEDNSKPKVEIAELYKGNLESYNGKNELLKQVKHILLEISPTCDFAQRKWRRGRLIPGLMWPSEHLATSSKKKKKNIALIKEADYIYSSPLLEKSNQIFKMVFDFRHLYSLSFSTLKRIQPAFRIKHELLVDIQSRLARHINRPGVTFIEESRKKI